MTLTNPATIYSIGQGNRNIGQLVSAMKYYGVSYLCDVRSIPISNHAPEFCRDELRVTLKKHGLKYVFFGHLLGGKPKDHTVLNDEGFVDYQALINSPPFQNGLGRIVDAAIQNKVLALFCSEGAPQDCHRAKAIGQALSIRGFKVHHIDSNDSIILQDDVFSGTQLAFFETSDIVMHSRKRIGF